VNSHTIFSIAPHAGGGIGIPQPGFIWQIFIIL